MSAAPRLHTLDAMRGVAAIAVVLFHISTTTPGIMPHGYLAVDFFFALSGMVIGRTYGARLTDGRLSIGRFALMRIVRLYPLYALGTAAGMAKTALGALVGAPGGAAMPAPLVAATCAAFMLPAPGDPDFLFPFNYPAWSLLLELLVNLAFALVLARLGTRALALVIAGAAAALIAVALGHGTIDLGSRWANLDGGAVRTLFGFAAGMMIGRTWRPVPVRSGTRALMPPLVLTTLLLMPATAPGQVWLDLACVMGAVPLLVMFGMTAEPPAGGARIAAWLGDLSYPLYAVHAPFVQTAVRAIMAGAPRAPVVAVTTAALLVIATLLARFYDLRARDWLSARLGLRRTAPLQAL